VAKKKKQQSEKADKGLLELDGEIVDVLPNQMFKVVLENGQNYL
jgi:translation initiation factor IF-1